MEVSGQPDASIALTWRWRLWYPLDRRLDESVNSSVCGSTEKDP